MPRPTARTELVIQGQNRTAGAFGQVDAGIAGLIGSLGKLRTVALAGAAAFGAFQLTRIINESVDAIDRLDRLSKQLGVSVGFIQELQYAARITGSDLETFADTVLDFEERLADAASGNKTYIEAFERIGSEVRELRQLRPEERFKAIAKGIAELNTEYERILAIRELGSDSATVMLNYFEDGAEGIDKMSKAFADLGVKLDDYQIKKAKEAKTATVNLTTAFEGLKNELVTGLAPALTEVANDLTFLVQGINVALGRADPLAEINFKIRDIQNVVEIYEEIYKRAVETKAGKVAEESAKASILRYKNILEGLKQKRQEILEPWLKEVRLIREELGGLNEELNDLISQRAKLEEEISDPHIGGTRFWVLESQIEELDKEIRVLTERKQALEKEARDAAAAGAVKPKPTPTGDIESQIPELEEYVVKAARKAGVLEQAIKEAIVSGGKRGSEAMVDTFLNTIRDRLLTQLSDAVAEAIFGPKEGAKNAEEAKRGGLFGILQRVNSLLGGEFGKKKPTSPEQAADSATQSLLPQSQGGLRCMPGQSPIKTALGGLGGIFRGIGKLLGFEHGGSFMVGGTGGPDSSLVAFRATPGERVSVQTPQQQSTMGNVQVTISNHVTVRGSDAEALRFAKVVSEATEARIIEARRRGRY